MTPKEQKTIRELRRASAGLGHPLEAYPDEELLEGVRLFREVVAAIGVSARDFDDAPTLEVETREN